MFTWHGNSEKLVMILFIEIPWQAGTLVAEHKRIAIGKTAIVEGFLAVR